MRAFTNWCARCLPLRISIVSCSRSSSLSFTTYFFTAISFAATNHLRPCGADVSIQRFATKSMRWGTSALSRSYCWVQSLQLNAGIDGGELPIRLGVVLIPGAYAGGDFLDQGLLVSDPPIETLRRQHAEFGFGHIQPTAVFGCVVPLEPLDEPACLGGREGFVE